MFPEIKSKEGVINLLGVHEFQITVINAINLTCSVGVAFLKSKKSLSQEMLDQSLTCALPEGICMADSGNDYPAACIFPFVDDSREFHACTDVNSPDPSK